jgi:hypothetical protein
MFTATRTWTSELSSIDTALLLAGVVDAKQYFTSDDPVEQQIREMADSIYYRVDWKWMQNGTIGIMMGWKPETGGFSGYGYWTGYNEAMIMYLLALGTPTFYVPTSAWSIWMSGYSWQTQYGYTYINFPPLFGHQYSHCWIDFRGIDDPYGRYYHITYHENSRRATLAQQAYCIANPLGRMGYGELMWGLTACDGPPGPGYQARGAPPAQNDDGTLAPTAVAGSLPFAPDVCIPTLQNLWDNYPQLRHTYGFRDAFNLGSNWWDPDVLGIDQGPIVLMIENFASEAVWSRFMQNADIQRGLSRAGFMPATTGAGERTVAAGELFQSDPNPFLGTTTIGYRLAQGGPVRLTLFDARGRRVATLLDAYRPAGMNTVALTSAGLASGVYQYRLEFGGQTLVKKCVLLKH